MCASVLASAGNAALGLNSLVVSPLASCCVVAGSMPALPLLQCTSNVCTWSVHVLTNIKSVIDQELGYGKKHLNFIG